MYCGIFSNASPTWRACRASSVFRKTDMVANMTPLVDVMLVLLNIFIITVPVISHAAKRDLPRAPGAGPVM